MDQTLCFPKSPFLWSSLPLWACLGSDVALSDVLTSLILSVSLSIASGCARQHRLCVDHYQDSAAAMSSLALMKSELKIRLRQINE